jgi:outer membrane protein TolC
MSKLTKISVALVCVVQSVSAQITPDQAVQAALKQNPTLQAATLEVQGKKHLEKASFNLPNPEINAESPTGEFYALGVLQSFEFPTVYKRQKQLAIAETSLALATQKVSENEIRFAVRNLYLDAQTAQAQLKNFTNQDSLYQLVLSTARRQFEAGEIDQLQKTLVENEVAQIRQNQLSAERQYRSALALLSMFTGIPGTNTILPLQPDTSNLLMKVDYSSNPLIAFEKQAVVIADKQLALQKSKALPNFTVGYLNQGAIGTPLDYRFRAAIGIPIWRGQFRSTEQAALVYKEAAQKRVTAQVQLANMEQERLDADLVNNLNQLRYYQQEALPRSAYLITTARRMRDEGQIDYIVFLRTLEEAYIIQRDYTDQVRALNAAIMRANFLAGK